MRFWYLESDATGEVWLWADDALAACAELRGQYQNTIGAVICRPAVYGEWKNNTDALTLGDLKE